jgi:hypothetical protein
VDRPLSLGRGVVKLLLQSGDDRATAGRDHLICGNNEPHDQGQARPDGALREETIRLDQKSAMTGSDGCRRLPANLCAGSADVRRYYARPANRVGTLVHYIWLVNAAPNVETEHVRADAAAPIRLRRRAHGAHGDGTESLFRLVLLDVIGKRELRATDRCLLVEPVGGPGQTNTPCLCWRA